MYYPDNDLDSPPPQSQFRRPWSPEPYDPHLPGTSPTRRTQPGLSHRQTAEHGQEPSLSYAIPSMARQQRQQRREASEVSVEALDLADYSRTLRARQAEDPYPPFPSQFHPEPEPGSRSRSTASFPQAPAPVASGSRDSLALHNHPHVPAPTPISRGQTVSSSMTHDTLATRRSDAALSYHSSQHQHRPHHHPPHSSSSSSRGRGSSSNRSGRRPFSLPNTPISRSPYHQQHQQYPPSSYPNRGPHIVDPAVNVNDDPYAPSQEIDISSFPRWSRGWYANHQGSGRQQRAAAQDPGDDPYSAYPPAPRLDSMNSHQHQSIFDPEYKPDPYSPNNYNTYSSDVYDLPPPLSSLGHESTRNLLPWSNNDPPDYNGGSAKGPIDPQVKAERLRLLEREFGSQGKAKGNNSKGKLVDEDGKPLVGTVDEKGALVTSGPKRRIALRAAQIAFALGAAIPGIYAAIAIKPSTSTAPTPPPANKPPAYVLYVVSCITFVALFYLFALHPCFCARRRPKHDSLAKHNPANMGMMVLPVSTLGPASGKKKANKGGKKGKHGQAPGDVQVNLIVDPAAFRGPEEDESDDEDGNSDGEGYESGSMPGGFGGSSSSGNGRRKRRGRARRRRGIFEGLAMEEEWKKARAWAKKIAFFDVFGVLVWGAVFVFVMIGERCPAGGFDGWCNAYNVSTASACLLCVAFGVGVFFDVQDLHASKQSPRTRT